ncbi:hypothetical protein KC921_00115 [Candidatus Woesebacteria bacterium]|nr:hypothetical protein [Candidatus Woesebacteria bacterium]
MLEKKTATELVARQMANLGEYVQQLTTDPSALKDLVIKGGNASDLLALQPSVLGERQNVDGEEVVVWGGEGSEVASTLTAEQLGPLVNDLLKDALEAAEGKEDWVPYALRHQRRWRIPAGDSVIVVDVQFDEDLDRLVPRYASI